MLRTNIELIPRPYHYSEEDFPNLYPWIARSGCRFEVRWDCSDDPNCGYARWFATEEEAHLFGRRVRVQCPNDLFYPDEAEGDFWREHKSA